MKKQAVFFGELLMRLATKRHERFVQAREFDVGYTGAEANAAVSLANYGVDCTMVSRVPDTEIGQACVNHLRGFGLNTDHITRGGRRLGTLFLETGASQRPSAVIYDRTGSAFSELQVGDIDWDNIFPGKDWFHFCGTAPALGDNLADVVSEACRCAREHGLTVSCDLNYRSKLWTPEEARPVMTGLMEHVDVLIGNPHHADVMLGITPGGKGEDDATDCADVAAQLHATFGCRYVAMTMREDISASETTLSALLQDGETSHAGTSYTIRHIVDRVGAGDAFAGALTYGLLSGMSPQETIEFATAAACLKHSVPGDFNLVSLDEVLALARNRNHAGIRR